MSCGRPGAALALLLVLPLLLSLVVTTDARERDGGKRAALELKHKDSRKKHQRKSARAKRSGPVVPKTGNYSAEPIRPTGDFQLGSFAVVRDRGKTRIVALETQKGIYLPDTLECASTSSPLRKETIRVNRSGRFKVRDSRRTAAGKLVVRWSGRWVRPGKVRGQVRVKLKGCKATYRWKARRLPTVIG